MKPSVAGDELISVETVYGKTVNVLRSQVVAGTRNLLPIYSDKGIRTNECVHRGNIKTDTNEYAPEVVLERELRATGIFEIAEYPYSYLERRKLTNDGFYPVLKHGEAVVRSDLGLVWIKPIKDSGEPVGSNAKVIVSIDEIQTGAVVSISGGFFKEPTLVKCLGNYGVGDKVYLTPVTSNETPETLAEKFSKNIMPDCFVCWDFEINSVYEFKAA